MKTDLFLNHFQNQMLLIENWILLLFAACQKKGLLWKTIEIVIQVSMILSFVKTNLVSFSTFFLHFHTLLSSGVLIRTVLVVWGFTLWKLCLMNWGQGLLCQNECEPPEHPSGWKSPAGAEMKLAEAWLHSKSTAAAKAIQRKALLHYDRPEKGLVFTCGENTSMVAPVCWVNTFYKVLHVLFPCIFGRTDIHSPKIELC